MAATNQTPVLKLPQFVGTDKPSWLGDFNEAMQKIDTGVGDNTGKIGAVETIANAAKATADNADSAVTALGGEVSRIATEQDSQSSEIDALQGDVETIQSKIDSISPVDAMLVEYWTAGPTALTSRGQTTIYRLLTSDKKVVCLWLTVREAPQGHDLGAFQQMFNFSGNIFNLAGQPTPTPGSNFSAAHVCELHNNKNNYLVSCNAYYDSTHNVTVLFVSGGFEAFSQPLGGYSFYNYRVEFYPINLPLPSGKNILFA